MKENRKSLLAVIAVLILIVVIATFVVANPWGSGVGTNKRTDPIALNATMPADNTNGGTGENNATENLSEFKLMYVKSKEIVLIIGYEPVNINCWKLQPGEYQVITSSNEQKTIIVSEDEGNPFWFAETKIPKETLAEIENYSLINGSHWLLEDGEYVGKFENGDDAEIIVMYPYWYAIPTNPAT